MSPTLYKLYYGVYSVMDQYLEVEFSVQHKSCGTTPCNHHIVSCCQGIRGNIIAVFVFPRIFYRQVLLFPMKCYRRQEI